MSKATIFEVHRNENGEQVYHLSSDIGLIKQSLKNRLRTRYDRDGDGDEWYERCKVLISRHGQWYTLGELDDLAALTSSAHDTCVLEHPEDYSPVEVYVSERNEETERRVYKLLAILRATETEPLTAPSR